MKSVGKKGAAKFRAKQKALLTLCKAYGYKQDDYWHGHCQACGQKDLSILQLDPMHKFAAGSKWRMTKSAFERADAEGLENLCGGCRPCHTVIDQTPELRRAMEASTANVKNGELIKWTKPQKNLLMKSPKRPNWI